MSTSKHSLLISYGQNLILVMECDKEIKNLVSTALAEFRRQQPMVNTYAKLCGFPAFKQDFAQNGTDRDFPKFYLAIEELASKKFPATGELFRMDVEEYAMLLAVAAASRSEDPSRKCGAVALDKNNRCIATAYNGLAAGTKVDFTWWENDDNRRKKVIHAEENLVSLTGHGDVMTVAVTLLPCGPCARLLAGHGVKKVLYGREYQHDTDGKEILADAGVELKFISAQGAADNLKSTLPFIL
jgi:dCMP deaminase